MRESMSPDVRARWAALLPTAGPMSLDELMALPEHRWRYELIAGQLRQRPLADLRHDMISRLLASNLRDYVRTAGIEGAVAQEIGVVLSDANEPATVLVPSLAFRHTAATSESGTPAGMPIEHSVPELVVEIAAPGQERLAIAERAHSWLGVGVRVVWVIWPARRQVDVWQAQHESQASGQTSTPEFTVRNVHELLEAHDVLPGFTYPVAHLFD